VYQELDLIRSNVEAPEIFVSAIEAMYTQADYTATTAQCSRKFTAHTALRGLRGLHGVWEGVLAQGTPRAARCAPGP
jgi:hypothetical protein